VGLPDALGLAQTHGDLLRAGLGIKKAGNAIVALLGGREIHPINVRVGGFYRVPARSELDALIPELVRARDAMCEALEFFGTLSFPDFERDYEFVALCSEDEYAVYDGRIRSNKGLDIAVEEYERYFEEHQVPHSTALHSLRVEPGLTAIAGGRAYVCGPLARFNLSFEQLRPRAREAARQAGLEPPCCNPHRSLLVRSIEIIQALETALALIDRYVEPAVPAIAVPHRAGAGHGCTEAPRGLLYHRYALNPDGAIDTARIVPPTSQNQASIEGDLFELASSLADLPIAEARSKAERAVRNYDPCISCSTHFLDLRIEREAT
jgi:sulfhydrogenase subunit alpha